MAYEKNKESIIKYMKSEKGKEAHSRAAKKWRDNNKDKIAEYNKQYFSTEAGKAKKREINRRYREKMKQKKSTI